MLKAAILLLLTLTNGDNVQAEFARRKALGNAYSGKSVFSAKLVCEDCSAFFGSKVWHSTDRYRRTIWQCNSKFKNKERCQTPTIDMETVQQLEETQVVTELIKTIVKENAVTAQSQEAYINKYEALIKRYEAAAAELERLQNLRTPRSQKDKAIALYIRNLKKQPNVLQEWNDTIWTVMVEKAVVHRNGEISFVFKNGTEIRVGA